MKDHSETRITPAALDKYLTENNLELTFRILSNAVLNYIGRKQVLKEKSDLLKNTLTSPLPSREKLYFEMSKIHLQQLDLLSSIFMFLEDFLAYSFNLNESLSKLQEFPTKIASENYDISNKGIKNLRNKEKSDIAEYLLFPDVGPMLLGKEEKNLLRIVFERMSTDVYNRIQSIIKFYDNHYRVYIKYKHVLTAIVGLHEIIDDKNDPLKKTVASHIYVRDRYKKEFRTHIIACNLETVTYYEEITGHIGSIFQLLLISYLHYLMNYGTRVVIPIGTYIKDKEKNQWGSILSTNKVKVLYPNFKTEIKIFGELAHALLNILPKKYIYTKKSDFFLQS